MGDAVLVVDDSRAIRSLLVDTLRENGYDCREASDGQHALKLLASGSFDLVISDIVMPGMSGIDLLQALRATYGDTFVVMLTSISDTETAMHCIHLGAVDYLIKPFTTERLLVTVRNVLEQRRLFLEQRAHKEELERKVREQTEQIRVAIQEMAMVTKEMEIARAIQSALIPQSFPCGGCLEFATLYRPTGQLGGDYYDVFMRANGILDLVIADVAGHNVGSALIVAEMRGALLGQHDALEHSCAEMLALLNESLYEDLSRAELFVTMFYLRFDARSMSFSYSSAGHNNQLLLRHNGELVELTTDGMIIGVLPTVEFEEKTLPLGVGDRIVLFTDGLLEAENRHGDRFGHERLADTLAAVPAADSRSLMQHLLGELESFLNGMSLEDDLSLVVATVR